MQRRPQVKLSYGRQNEPIRVPISDLLLNVNKSFFITDCIAGSISGTTQSIDDFTTNQCLLLGTPGNDSSEIVHTDPSIAPTGNTVTFAAVTTQTHQSNSYVYVLDFDQVEFSYSATLTGAKTVLATVPVAPDSLETYYNDVTQTTGFYFARFKNSLSTTFSQYSDACPVGISYGNTSVRYIIDSVLGQIGKKTSSLFSDEFFITEINNLFRMSLF